MSISATVVCDSLSPAGVRLTTVQVTAHRFILAEINTHRMLSRNYRSSRAVPVKKLLEEVRTNPAMPVFWGKNQAGMQAAEELTGTELAMVKTMWRSAANSAVAWAEGMAQVGLHKQTANRVLEPFLYVHGVITATEWDNFFGLRLHRMAMPEFKALADAIWPAIKHSVPMNLEPGQWHLPYVGPTDHNRLWCEREDKSENLNAAEVQRRLLITSVARCARVTASSFETGKESTWSEDLRTYARLNIPGTDYHDPSEPIHASPAEHQATPDKNYHLNSIEMFDPYYRGYRWETPQEHGNFTGWRQYRKMLPGENRAPLPREYRDE